MRRAITLMLLGACTWAADTPADPWWWGHPLTDGSPGVGLTVIRRHLIPMPPTQPIVVAVLDSGVQVDLPELAPVIWSDPAETGGLPGVDDDGDGYVDEVHGWNWLAARDGTPIVRLRWDVARRLVRAKDAAAAAPADPALQQQLAVAQHSYDQALQVSIGSSLRAHVRMMFEGYLRDKPGDDPYWHGVRLMMEDRLARWPEATALIEQTQRLVREQYALEDVDGTRIGDRGIGSPPGSYGNADVRPMRTPEMEADADDGWIHGTACAGLVVDTVRAASVAGDPVSFLRIMPLRVVVNGDEREHDVAAAIRFAVRHGAKIVSCSFSKTDELTPGVEEAAVREAIAAGALLVLAAGNEERDLDILPVIPRLPAGPTEGTGNVLVVGAQSWRPQEVIANFSNYGVSTVDVLAPGERIEILRPDGARMRHQGSSFAAPIVAGIATLLWSQHPDWTATQVADRLRATARTYDGIPIRRPGSDEKSPKMFLRHLVRAGVIDAWAAIDNTPPRPIYPPPSAQP